LRNVFVRIGRDAANRKKKGKKKITVEKGNVGHSYRR